MLSFSRNQPEKVGAPETIIWLMTPLPTAAPVHASLFGSALLRASNDWSAYNQLHPARVLYKGSSPTDLHNGPAARAAAEPDPTRRLPSKGHRCASNVTT